MKKYILIMLLGIIPVLASGNELIKSIKIDSSFMNEEREIIVAVPSIYERESFYEFPVLYLTDASEQLNHIASMVDYLQGTISPMIVVGIVQENRFDELTPFSSNKKESKASSKFQQFILNEVKSYVEDNYRTADFSIFAGHSLGGAFALNMYQKFPNSFDAFVSLAPSLAWGNETLLELVPKRFDDPSQPFLSVFFEGVSPFPTPQQSFNNLNQAISEKPNLQATHSIEILKNEDHLSVAHLGVYRALTNLYQGWFLYLPQVMNSDDAFSKHYDKLSKKLGYQIKPTEYDLYELVSVIIGQGQLDLAQNIAIQSKSYYPNSHYSYSLLADVAKARGDVAVEEGLLRKAISLTSKDKKRKKHYEKRLKNLTKY